MKTCAILGRRALVVAALGLWLGGLTLYALVAIPAAHEVLGSHTKVGFITQKVTRGINLIACLALAVLLANAIADWSRGKRLLRLGETGSWVLMALSQAALFVVHGRLDALLDPVARQVIDPARFYRTHEVYLIVTGVQWHAGLVYLACALVAWRRADAAAPPDRTG